MATSSSRREWPLVALLFLIALVVRSPFAAGPVLSLDEAVTLTEARGVDYRFVLLGEEFAGSRLTGGETRPLEVLRAVRQAEGTPPLHFLLLSGALSLFGDTPRTGRWLSAFLGAVVVTLTWCLTRAVAGADAALVAGLLAAVSAAEISGSMHVRYYGLATVLALASTLALIVSLRDPRRRRWGIAYVLLATAGVHTTYFFGAILAAHALCLFITGERRRALLPGVPLLLLLPWLGWAGGEQLARVSRVEDIQHAGWAQLVKQAAGFAGLLVYGDRRSLIGGAAGEWWLAVSFVLLLAAAAVLGTRALLLPRCAGRRDGVILLGAAVALPLVLVGSALLRSSAVWLAPRYAAPAVPLALCLVSIGLVATFRLPVLAWLAAALVLLQGLQLPGLEQQRVPWDRVAAHLEREGRSGDRILFDHGSGAIPFNQYYRGPLPQLGVDRLTSTEQVDSAIGTRWRGRIWLIRSWQRNPAVDLCVNRRGHLVESREFGGIGVELLEFIRRENVTDLFPRSVHSPAGSHADP